MPACEKNIEKNEQLKVFHDIKELDKYLEELDEEIGDQVKIVKMDVDANPEVPSSFGIMSIPTLLVKKDGEVVEKLIGYHNKEQVEDVIAKYK